MIKTNPMRVLEENAIPYTPHEYDVSDGQTDAVTVAHRIGAPPEQVFKTLVAENTNKELFVFVIPGPENLDLKKAAKAAGQKALAMLPQKRLFPETGYIHGGCSPLCMKKKLPTFFEETAQLYDEIYVSAGKVGLNLCVPPEPLCSLVGGQYADLIRE